MNRLLLLASAAFASAAGMATPDAHERRVRELMAQLSSKPYETSEDFRERKEAREGHRDSTRNLCEACVNAEEELVTAMGEREELLETAEQKAEDAADATDAHSDSVDRLSDRNGEVSEAKGEVKRILGLIEADHAANPGK